MFRGRCYLKLNLRLSWRRTTGRGRSLFALFLSTLGFSLATLGSSRRSTCGAARLCGGSLTTLSSSSAFRSHASRRRRSSLLGAASSATPLIWSRARNRRCSRLLGTPPFMSTLLRLGRRTTRLAGSWTCPEFSPRRPATFCWCRCTFDSWRSCTFGRSRRPRLRSSAGFAFASFKWRRRSATRW